MHRIRELVSGEIPPNVRRFIKRVGRGINRFDMIRENDSILLGVSGGKDSLALALALAVRRRWMPVSYELKAVQIDWREYPLAPEERERIGAYFDALEIPFRLVPASMFPESFRGKFNCYLCARNRKRILFDELARLGARKVALGHHMDDIVETTIINLAYHGNFSTMMPVQRFFEGKIELIRPMCEVRESTVDAITRFLELPVVKIDCPYRETNIRSLIKPIIRDLGAINRHVRENIYRAHWNISSILARTYSVRLAENAMVYPSSRNLLSRSMKIPP